MRRSLLVCLISTSLFAQPAQCQSVALRSGPKLILALMVDQFRYDYLVQFRSEYHSGLARLLDNGAVFVDAHHAFFPTVTALGHTSFLSGAAPSVSGIIGNEWYDRASGQSVTSVSDETTQLIGGRAGDTASSPRRLLVDTLPDELRLAHRASTVIGISIKDRSAILPVGHMADAAYWFDGDTNHFVTSTYYMKALPEWVKTANDLRPASKYLGVSWYPVAAKPGDKPFCSMVAGGEDRYCGSFEATPFGNEMLEEFAERAIRNEKLGQHDGIDVLMLSLSSNDYVGHALGPDAPEVRDMCIRTDRLIGKLLDMIDAQNGEGNTLLVMTADHGVAPVPEVNQARKMPGGRLDSSQLARAVNTALSARFGEGNWITYEVGGTFYLNYDTVSKCKADLPEVRRVAAEALRTIPHIARVYTSDQLVNAEGGVDPVSRAMVLGFYAPRSADLIALPEPYYIFAASGTTHGTPYNYDTHVPIIFYGPGIRPGVYLDRVAVSDIAATLAAMLHVEPPSGSSGRILSEILK